MIRFVAATVSLITSLSMVAPVRAESAKKVDDPTGWSVGGGIGAAASPGQFVLQLDAPYRFSELFSAAPTFQLLAGSSFTRISMSLDGVVHLNLFDESDNVVLANLTPHVGLGAGFTHFSAFGFNETNFLLPIIMGLEFDLTEEIALTNEMRFNIVVTSDFDTFYWSWQLIGVRYRF